MNGTASLKQATLADAATTANHAIRKNEFDAAIAAILGGGQPAEFTSVMVRGLGDLPGEAPYTQVQPDGIVTDDPLEFLSVTIGNISGELGVIANRTEPGALATAAMLPEVISVTNLENGHSAILRTTSGVFSAGLYINGTKVVGAQQPNIADTSGATLGQLETSVNTLKAMLRTMGIMAAA